MSQKKDKDINRKESERAQANRRVFLKKAAYATPTLMVLGELVRPREAKADFGGPPSDAIWN